MLKKTILLSTLTTSLLLASAYRLPESSVNSTALSGAYIANANGADAAYYNPANMAFNEDRSQIEGAVTYINLSKIKYTDDRNPLFNGHTETENLFAPSLFFSSKSYNGLRYGFSLNVPGGLSKRWKSPYPQLFAEEFTLKIIEMAPSIAYKVNDQFAIGGGVRLIYSEGVVKSDGVPITVASKGAVNKPAARDMEADTIEYGYNLALTYKPIENMSVAATYRSNVDLNYEGNAKLYLSGTKLYDGGASVEVPLPAVASLAFSYDFENTTVEIEWDRTFWSEYKALDFQFKDSVPRALQEAYDAPKPRDWEDTDAYRLGITHKLDSKLTLMGGVAYDENPEPEKNVGFELPDSDALIFSGGFTYAYTPDMTLGASLLYDSKDKRTVHNDSVSGTFEDASALLVTFGVAYNY
jgi:long-chain fatty acid transport protein